MDDILKVIRTERHDFLNHLQVISGLVQLNKQDKVLEYIEKVTKEIYSLGKITRLGSSQIAATLLLKNYEAHQKGITLEIGIETDLDEMGKDLGNFSDNLNELLEIFFDISNEVKLIASEEAEHYVFEVNCPKPIAKDDNGRLIKVVNDFKELTNTDGKYFDTDKRIRVYLTTVKAK